MKNTTKTVFVFLISLIAAAVRAFQLLNTVDPATGNSLNEYIPMQMFFGIVVAVLFAAAAVLGFCSKPQAETIKKSRSLGIGAVILAMSAIYDAFLSLWKILSDFSSFDAVGFVMFLLTAVSALYFVSLAYSMLVKKSEMPAALLPAVVVVQQTVRLVILYIGNTKSISLAEHKYDILLSAVYVLFWAFYARSTVNNTKLRRFTGLFSAAAVFTGIAVILPRIAARFLPEILPELYPVPSAVFSVSPFSAQDAATVLFAAIFIFCMNRKTDPEEFVPEPMFNEEDDDDDDDFLSGVHAITGENDRNNDKMLQTIFGTTENARSFAVKTEEKPKKNPFKIVFEDDVTAENNSDGGENVETEQPQDQTNESESDPRSDDSSAKISEDIPEAENSETVFELPQEPQADNTEAPAKAESSFENAVEEEDPSKNETDEIIDNLLDEIMSKFREEE